jgi:cation-transporting ATPase E
MTLSSTPAARSLAPLTQTEVTDRVAQGYSNVDRSVESRSVASILKGNIVTRFNAIVSVLLVVVLVFGEPPDALFGLVMIANAAIGIVQELRAKITLDKLRVVAAPKATVNRDVGIVVIATEAIVRDDLLVLRRGEQIPVDGSVVESDGLEVSEALLTGEADPVTKEIGAPVMSGSFVVSGTGVAVVTAVGDEAYATRLAQEARQFTLSTGELRTSIDRILRIVTWLLIPTAALLLWSQMQTGESISDGLVAAVAGVVAMVPQGLVLLVSVSLAVAVVRLAKRHALVQELQAVETLARVDTLCVDKTGTLTSGGIVLDQVAVIGSEDDDAAAILGMIAAVDPDPNTTMQALRDAFPLDTVLDVDSRVPFSSGRKMSAVSFEDGTAWVMGAPEFVLTGDQRAEFAPRIAAFADDGKRVVVIAKTDPVLVAQGDPEAIEPAFLAVFTETIRPDAADTVSFFMRQGVDLKVISGDSPDTVAAVAHTVGINPVVAIDASTMPDADDDSFAAVVAETTVFGRVSPERKRELVVELQRQGLTVAMTGDGVNDVLALKQADMGIAMGSGSSATRAVAQLVLLDDTFASLPEVVAEGRRVVANMERVASLFLTKTVYATLLAVAIGLAVLPFPFLPRHMTLIGLITIGTPAFVLSFEKHERPIRPGFLTRVLAFAVPAGLVAGLTTFTLYGMSRLDRFGFTVAESRTAATILMVFIGLVVIHDLVAPPTQQNRVLIGGLLAGFLAILAVPAFRSLFNLVIPDVEAWVVIAATTVLASFVLKMALIAGRRVAERTTDVEIGFDAD